MRVRVRARGGVSVCVCVPLQPLGSRTYIHVLYDVVGMFISLLQGPAGTQECIPGRTRASPARQ